MFYSSSSSSSVCKLIHIPALNDYINQQGSRTTNLILHWPQQNDWHLQAHQQVITINFYPSARNDNNHSNGIWTQRVFVRGNTRAQ